MRIKTYWKKFTDSPSNFLAQYGANWGGFFWNCGTAAQFIFGLIEFSPLQLASAAFNIASPCTYMFFGHKNFAVSLGGVLGIIGTLLAVYPQIIAGEAASIFGFLAFCVFVGCSIFSVPLTKRFARSKDVLLRVVLGHPRRISGLGSFFFTRIPIIAESLYHSRWQLAVVFALWACGDFVFSFSRATASKHQH